GNLDVLPALRPAGCPGRLGGPVDQAEPPRSVEREQAGATAVERRRRLGRLEGQQRRARRQRAQARQLGLLPARLPARVEERRERRGEPRRAHGAATRATSRSILATASGATGLKKTPEPSSPAATKRITPAARQGETISTCKRACGQAPPSKGRWWIQSMYGSCSSKSRSRRSSTSTRSAARSSRPRSSSEG